MRIKKMRRRSGRTLLVLQAAVGMTFLSAGSASAQVPPPIVSADAARRARSLLKEMTLEEKIGQLNLAAGVGLGGMIAAASDDDITRGRVGAILWLADPEV